MNDTIVGLDLAKNVFHAIELDHRGRLGWRKKFSRSQLKRFFVNHPPITIAMEACASAHYWARLFRGMGHAVKLLPPQHVKGYLRGQKNDYNDARAIAEACHHGSIRPVPIKSVEQQDEQAFHRIRQQRVGEQTRLANQIRGLLGEYGIIVAKGIETFRKALPVILEDAENGLTPRFRELLNRQYYRLLELHDELAWFDLQLREQSSKDLVCRRLSALPGFGPVVSSAVKCWMGDGLQFPRGRAASAALGVVPRQHTSGDKEVLLGISKRGDSYTRSLVIHGARSVVMRAGKKQDPLSCWITHLVETRGFNKAVVALANKLIRMAWVIIARGEDYRAPAALT